MFKFKVIGLSTFLYLVPYHLAVAQYDGSVPLLCAPIQAIDCDVEDPCLRGTPDDVNIPNFFRINLQEKMITAVKEGGRQTAIKNIERINGKTILQGVQDGRGWTMIMSEHTGKMSATVSDDGVGFVVFGACTPLP